MNLNMQLPRKQQGWIQFLPAILGAAGGLLSSRNAPDKQTTTRAGGSSGVQNMSSTQTTQQDVNPLLAPYAQQLLRESSGSAGGVAPISGLTSQFAGLLGDTIENPGSNQFASGQSINPHLNTVFDAAADATQNRLSSEFSRAGRLGSGANQQARSQELQQLAAGIYGPGFEAERQRQFGATEANIGRNFGLLSQVPGIGDRQQATQQAVMDRPAQNVNQRINRLQGLAQFFPGAVTSSQQGQTQQASNQTGNVSQPLYNNPFLGAAGGAMMGMNLFGKPQDPNQMNPVPNVGFNPIEGLGGLGYFGSAGGRENIIGNGSSLNPYDPDTFWPG